MLALLGIGMWSCKKDEPEKQELKFETVGTSNREDVKLSYTSPDPCCLGYSYYIIANGKESTLSIRCTNAETLNIYKCSDSPYYFAPVRNEKRYFLVDASNEDSKWSVTLKDGNELCFKFKNTIGIIENYDAKWCYLYFFAIVDGERVDGMISIHRYVGLDYSVELFDI